MKPVLIQAHLATALAGLVTGNELPTQIQWMPPGKHTINATEGGKPVTYDVIVDASTADRINAILQELRTKAANGVEDLPYFDFNHDDEAASARPTRFYWAGDDIQAGGVRVDVEWTEPGKAALLGKAYRRFSPSFFLNAAGVVVGAPVNMGGLVNRAAFKNINPIVASDPGDGNKTDMKTPEQLATELAQAIAKITELEAKLATSQNTATIQAKDVEITGLKADRDNLKAMLATQAKASAKAVVDAAVAAGKLAPQNTAIHAKWIDAIAANPDLAETLNAMPVNAALATTVNKPGAGGAPAAVAGEHAFLTKAKAAAQAEKKDLSTAIVELAAKESALYDDYRATLGETK